MKKNRAFSVFVSSTQLDLKEERAKVFKALLEDGHIPQAMEYFPSSSEVTINLINSFLDNCDILISISQARYGAIAPSSDVSFTELEWDYAKKRCIPCIPFIHNNIGKVEQGKCETDALMREKLERFQSKMRQQNVQGFSNPDELASLVKSAVNNEIRTNGLKLTGWIRRDVPSSSQFPEGLWRLSSTSKRDWENDGVTKLKLYFNGVYQVLWVDNLAKSAMNCHGGTYSTGGGYYDPLNITEVPKYGSKDFLAVIGSQIELSLSEHTKTHMKCEINVDGMHHMTEEWERVDDPASVFEFR